MGWFSRDEEVTPEQFAEIVSEALRAAGFDVLETNLDEFTLRGAFGMINLASFYSSYNTTRGAEREHIVAGIVESATIARDHEFPGWEQARAHLRVVVRSERFHQLMELMARAEEREHGGVLLAHRRLASGLHLNLAYDTPTVTTSVPVDQLETWGVELEQALEVATNNLRDLDDLDAQRTPSGFYVIAARDGYETGRMAIPDVFHRLELPGDPVVIPGIRDAMLVAGSEDERALVGMAETALDLMNEGQWVCFSAFVHDGDVWTHFRPTLEHPVSPLLRQLELLELREDYESQRPFLAQLFGEELFVPQLIVGEREGRVRSFATWGEGVRAALPVADSVVLSLLDPDDPEAYGEMIDVSFDDMFEVIGHHLSRLDDVLPERFYTESWPSAEELEELRRRSERGDPRFEQHH